MPDPVAETANLELDSEPIDEVPGSEPEVGTGARAMRLRQAVDSAGGTVAIARQLGMPIGTLSRYRRGREMKVSAMIQLAQATGVQLEWLATGEGPMRAGEPPPAARPAAAQPEPLRLFGRVRIDRLVDAYEGALATTKGADKRLTMHLTVLLYDQLTEAAEARENRGAAGLDPQTSPQKGSQE
jgi:hypothetical protein